MLNYKFTIFTPTYNRENTLLRCYQSILDQNIHDIEWIVIDDGSIDQTKALIHSIMKTAPFEITYIYQKNSGKQACWNLALSKAKGEFFIGLDSDDCLADNSLSNIRSYLSFSEKTNIIGLRCQSLNKESNTFDSKYMPENGLEYSWYNEFFSKKHGEKIDVFKTELIKKMPYPITEDIKFIPELYLYNEISANGYLFLYLNIPVRVFFNDQPAFTRLSNASTQKNCLGYFIAYSSLYDTVPLTKWISSPVLLARVLFRLNQSVFYLKIDSTDSFKNLKIKSACILVTILNKFRKK